MLRTKYCKYVAEIRINTFLNTKYFLLKIIVRISTKY